MLFICEAHTLFAITENFLSLMPSWLPFSISVISTNFSFIGLISCQSLWMKHSVLTSILGQMSKYSLLRIFFSPVNFIFQLPDQLLFKSLLPRLIWESAVIRTNRYVHWVDDVIQPSHPPVQHYGKQCRWASKKLKIELPYDPEIPLLSLYLKEQKH